MVDIVDALRRLGLDFLPLSRSMLALDSDDAVSSRDFSLSGSMISIVLCYGVSLKIGIICLWLFSIGLVISSDG